MGVYRYFKEWRKNPHWSFSCCLALFLPLNDLRGEIGGFAATDALNSQVKTVNMEMPTILLALEESGVTEDELENETIRKQGYDDTTEEQEQNVRDRNLNNKCNQETQTQLLALYSIANNKNPRENRGEMIINYCK